MTHEPTLLNRDASKDGSHRNRPTRRGAIFSSGDATMRLWTATSVYTGQSTFRPTKSDSNGIHVNVYTVHCNLHPRTSVDPPAVHQAVGAFQISMSFDVRTVKISQAFNDVVHEREFEHPIEGDSLLFKNVLQTSSLTKFDDEARVLTIETGADETRLKRKIL